MKKQIHALLIQQMAEEFETLQKIQDAATGAATHEENRAENQYDTRSTEAAYLAAGQAQRLDALKRMLHALKQFPLKETSGNSVELGSLIELHSNNELQTYFLLPMAGGYKVPWKNNTIQIITPESLLGQALLGKRVGDEVEIRARTLRTYIIKSLN